MGIPLTNRVRVKRIVPFFAPRRLCTHLNVQTRSTRPTRPHVSAPSSLFLVLPTTHRWLPNLDSPSPSPIHTWPFLFFTDNTCFVFVSVHFEHTQEHPSQHDINPNICPPTNANQGHTLPTYISWLPKPGLAARPRSPIRGPTSRRLLPSRPYFPQDERLSGPTVASRPQQRWNRRQAARRAPFASRP